MVGPLDVCGVVYPRTPLVVDVELVDGVGKAFDEVADDKFVVHTVAIRRHHVREDKVVVDEEDSVLDGIGTLHQMAARSVVVGANQQTRGVAARNVLSVGRCPLPGRIVVGEGLVRVRHIPVILDFPEVDVVAVVGGSIVDKRDGGV